MPPKPNTQSINATSATSAKIIAVTLIATFIPSDAPFEKIGIAHGESVEFFMANTDSGVKNTYIPQEILLSMTRE